MAKKPPCRFCGDPLHELSTSLVGLEVCRGCLEFAELRQAETGGAYDMLRSDANPWDHRRTIEPGTAKRQYNDG